jgi:hypothetical protein
LQFGRDEVEDMTERNNTHGASTTANNFGPVCFAKQNLIELQIGIVVSRFLDMILIHK